ncbi:hypothetical protein [Streptomyces sp. NPDC050287]|uniref:hypothetical protein n=1 Tax=Streptomyces sp. NPDC050287 TaxID=3365608 RepID=UPI0037AE9A19
MNGQDSGLRLEPVELERRLEAALRARADSVGLSDLRPADPPSGALPARVTVRRAALALLALAAVVIGVVLMTHREEHPPIRPQTPPAITRSTSPAPPSPQPSAVATTFATTSPAPTPTAVPGADGG